MPGASEGLQLLRKYSDGTYSDFEYIADACEPDFVIERGLLFLMAFWSGPAVVGFKNLCGSLATADIPNGFVFRVLDWDGATQFLERLSTYDVTIGGNAEGFWYRRREVIAATTASTATPQRIQELLTATAQP